VVLELAKQISETFSKRIIEHNWKGVKEFGVGETNSVEVRVNARTNFVRIYFGNEEKKAFIVIENNEITSFQNPESMKKVLEYMSKMSDKLVHIIFDFDYFPTFVDKNEMLLLQEEKRKEKVNYYLDLYNENMTMYSLFNDKIYQEKANQMLLELKHFSALVK